MKRNFISSTSQSIVVSSNKSVVIARKVVSCVTLELLVYERDKAMLYSFGHYKYDRIVQIFRYFSLAFLRFLNQDFDNLFFIEADCV